MHSFHETAVVIEGHDHCIGRMTPRNKGDIRIFNHLVDDSPKTAASIGKINDSHVALPRFSALHRAGTSRSLAEQTEIASDTWLVRVLMNVG
jgi:hypothetical protein